MKGFFDLESDYIEVKSHSDLVYQLFYAAKTNDVSNLKELLEKINNENLQIDARNEAGCSALHIAALHNSKEAALLLLNHGASTSIQDYENAWTPLHRAFYKGHLKIALMLLTSGAVLGDNINNTSTTNTNMISKRPIRGRCIKNIDTWKSPIDHDGFTPLDLLTWKLSNTNFSNSKSNSSIEETSCFDSLVLSFGKADFQLGIPLPKQLSDIQKPRCLEDLPSNITKLSCNRHHTLALTEDGAIFSWGHGFGGKLGHGDEHTQPLPKLIDATVLNERKVKVTAIAAGEDHSLALTADGRVFAWGSDRHGQLGLGSRSASTFTTSTDTIPPSSLSSSVDSSIHVTSPLPVSGLRKTRVRGIAAGARHSMCFSETAVYTWGSNSLGQLGLSQRSAERTICVPRMVSLPVSTIVSVAAGPQSSLVLLHREEDASDRREVYQWGQGIQLPMRVPFSSRRRNSISESNGSSMSTDLSIFHSFDQGSRRPVELVQISAGRYFNCALSSTGYVYLWTIGSSSTSFESKERERDKEKERDHHEGNGYAYSNSTSSNNNNYVNTNLNTNINPPYPRVLEALFSENGGGKATFIDAASERVCVVMENGDLYTFDVPTTASNSKLPVPRRVIGVKCSESVVAGDHHTLVLTSLKVPPLPYQERMAMLSSEPLITMLNESQTDVKTKIALDASMDVDPEASFTEAETETDLDQSMSIDADVGMTIFDMNSEDENEQAAYDEEQMLLFNAGLDSTPQLLTQSEAEVEQFEQVTDTTSIGKSNVPFDTSSCEDNGVSPFPLSLKELCELRLAREVTVRNSPRLLDFANTYQAHALAQFCEQFITSNLDAVFVISKRSDLELLVTDTPLTRVEAPPSGTDSYLSAVTLAASSSASKLQGQMQGRHRSRSRSQSLGEGEENANLSVSTSQSDITPTKNKNNGNSNHEFTTPPVPQRARANSKDLNSYEGVARTIKSVKKKLHAIDALEKRVQEGENNLQHEQLEKLRRKNSLEEQLFQLEPLLNKLSFDETEIIGDDDKAKAGVAKEIDYQGNSREIDRLAKVKKNKKKEDKGMCSSMTTDGVPNFSAWLKMADSTTSTTASSSTTIIKNATANSTVMNGSKETKLLTHESPTLQEALLIGSDVIKSRKENHDLKNNVNRKSSWGITHHTKSNHISLSSILLEQKAEKQVKQLNEKDSWSTIPTKLPSSSSSSSSSPRKPVHLSISLSMNPEENKKLIKRNCSGSGNGNDYTSDTKNTTASISWGSYIEQNEEIQKQKHHDFLKAKCPWGSNHSKERKGSLNVSGDCIDNNNSISNGNGVSMASILQEEEALRKKKNLSLHENNGHSNPWKTGLISLSSSPYKDSEGQSSSGSLIMENILKMEEEKASTVSAVSPIIDKNVRADEKVNYSRRSYSHNKKNKRNTEEKNNQNSETESKLNTKKFNKKNTNNSNSNINKNKNNKRASQKKSADAVPKQIE